MYVSVAFVMSYLYSEVSLTQVREQRFCKNIINYLLTLSEWV